MLAITPKTYLYRVFILPTVAISTKVPRLENPTGLPLLENTPSFE